jgi:streptogramin lyase
VTSFDANPARADEPSALAVGADGNLWFTNANNRIGRITVDGVVSTYDTTAYDVRRPFDLTTGPDGNLWFTSLDNDRIGLLHLPVADGTGAPGAPAPEYQPFPWELIPELDPGWFPPVPTGPDPRCATSHSL